MQHYIINTDGGSRGNPGPASIGVVIADRDGKPVKEIGEYIGTNTNNVAEYTALVRALTEVTHLTDDPEVTLEVRMDSELVIRQMIGVYKVKDPGMKELYAQAQKLLPHFMEVKFTHVRREFNKRADALVNEALDAHA